MFRPVTLVRVNIYVVTTHVSRVSWVLARLGLLHLADVRQVTPSAAAALPTNEQELAQRCHALRERSKKLMALLSLPYEPWGLEAEVIPETGLAPRSKKSSGSSSRAFRRCSIAAAVWPRCSEKKPGRRRCCACWSPQAST